jgi:hypothetical protein
VRVPPLQEAAPLAVVLPLAPALRLSVAEVRLLLCALLPLPRRDLAAVLALLADQRRHKLAAYLSHRKRRLRLLAELALPP